MQLSDLIKRFRIDANDKVEPYFNDNESVTSWLNEAVNEACIRGRLLHESENTEVCKIPVIKDMAHYKLHDALYEISRIWFEPANGVAGSYIALTSAEDLDRTYYENWKTLTGFPRFAIQHDTGLRLVPTPNLAGKLQLEGYRVSIQPMVLDTDVPEINPIHHISLIQWALHKAFSVPDAEFFDPDRAAMAEHSFTEYFGERPDSDLRRTTREDVPHHVVPFMP